MFKFSILVVQLIFLIHCSQCWFFDKYFFNDVTTKWYNYKKIFNKSYSTQREHTFRKFIFQKNLDFVNKFNQDHDKGLYSFKTELNNFADLTIEEFLKQKTGLFVNKNNFNNTIRPPNLRQKRHISIPNSIDWRLRNKISPVQDQGPCGSCYAFATIAAVESFKAIKSNYMPSYSVQELIDCSIVYGINNNIFCDGCNGGSLSCGFAYVKNKSLSDANLLKSYPSYRQTFLKYKGREGVCRKMKDGISIINEFASYYGDATVEDLKLWLTYYGPIAVGINASPASFQFYKKGIYDDHKCDEMLNHAVLLVGFGSEHGKDYWIVKNSWSEKWGENGYMRIERGKNICGIETYGAFPFA